MKRLVVLLMLLGLAQVARAEDSPMNATVGSEEIQGIIKQGIAKNSERGVVCMVWSEGRIVAAVFAGYRDKAKTQPVRPDTRVRLGSISKQLLTISVLQLVAQGKFRLDDKIYPLLVEQCGITPFLPHNGRMADPRVKNITIRQVLNHTPGFDYKVSGDEPIAREKTTATEMGKTLPIGNEAFVAYTLGTVPLQHDPGTVYQYCNTGYMWLEPLVKKFGGCSSYVEYVYKHILGPAGIAPSDFCPTTIRRDGDPPADRAMEYNEGVTNLQLGSTLLSIGGWEATAAAATKLFVTLFTDYHRNTLLSDAMIEQMVSRPPPPYKSETSDWYYGLGLQIRPLDNGIKNYWHGGKVSNQVQADWAFCSDTGRPNFMFVAIVNGTTNHADFAFSNDFENPILHAMDRQWREDLDYTKRFFSFTAGQ